MTHNTVIKIENLSKTYRLGEIGTGTLSHDLNRRWAKLRGKEDPFQKVGAVNDRTQKAEKGEIVAALKDINLDVKQGEVLGIIGKNGAGKSTLLKILSRVTAPTTGKIRVRGRMASLLEVGTGFHPEMTGRENIYMNGTIMGMHKWEIRNKLDEIVEFAGVAKYIDTPAKRYSSGMTVRLGFAVAAFLDPEILIVDEVLAVGDIEFQRRAVGKMKSISTNDGRTVLIVSHNMESIRNICKKGVIIHHGQIMYEGMAEDCIEEYLKHDKKTVEAKKIVDNNTVAIRNSHCTLQPVNGQKELFIDITFEALQDFASIDFTIHIYNDMRILVCILTTVEVLNAVSRGTHTFRLKCNVTDFNVGAYYGTLRIIENKANFANLRIDDLFCFEIQDDVNDPGINFKSVVRPAFSFSIDAKQHAK